MIVFVTEGTEVVTTEVLENYAKDINSITGLYLPQSLKSLQVILPFLEKLVFNTKSRLDEGSTSLKGFSSLREVVLPERMEEIPDYFFHHCYSLEKVVWPKSNFILHAKVFDESRLKEFEVIETGNNFGVDSLFMYSEELSQCKIATLGDEKSTLLGVPFSYDLIPNFRPFTYEPNSKTLTVHRTTSLGDETLINSVSEIVERVIVKDTCQFLPKFYKGTWNTDMNSVINFQIKEIVCSENCPAIEMPSDYCFGLGNLERIVLPKGLNNFGSQCFPASANRIEIVWPETIITARADAFVSLKTREVKGVKFSRLESGAFKYSSIEELDITLVNDDNEPKVLSDDVFDYCTELRKATIHFQGKWIVKGAMFYCCDNLREVEFDGDLLMLGLTALNRTHENVVLGEYCSIPLKTLRLPGNLRGINYEDLLVNTNPNLYHSVLGLPTPTQIEPDFELIVDNKFVVPKECLALLRNDAYEYDYPEMEHLKTLREVLEELYPEQFAVYYGEGPNTTMEETSLF